MSKKFLLTAFCKDRPGVVADISQVIYENGCNLEDSAMASLADEFALMLLCSPLSEQNVAELESKLSQECRRLERDKGITAFIRAVEPEAELPFKEVYSQSISVEGLDQAGIVYKISRFLADNTINITKLNSRISPSPESGAPMYQMEMRVDIPHEVTPKTLKQGLNRIADELNVDITVG